ncbi:hypothetical protein NY10_869 [Carnobacterium antarcticum]|nr:hypothetical protein NY10_869 [Carnobacterium sp. CP1]
MIRIINNKYTCTFASYKNSFFKKGSWIIAFFVNASGEKPH